MVNYIKPGVYVKEVDLSGKVCPLLDFPEFSREVFEEILKKIPVGCGFNYKNSNMVFHGENISVNVTLHDGFANVKSHPLLDQRVEFSNPNAIDRIVSIIEAVMTNNTPIAWKNVVAKLEKIDVHIPNAEIIDSHEKLIEVFGEPLP